MNATCLVGPVAAVVVWGIAAGRGFSAEPLGPAQQGPVAFARAEIAAAAARAGVAAPAVAFALRPELGAQSYTIARSGAGITIAGGDAAGEMYGGLDLAEAVAGGPAALTALLADRRVHAPFIAQRGIKFNVPLDLRTPTYSDASDSAQANLPEVWSREFWSAFLDEMARRRLNVLTLWSLHPFPSLVRVPEYPEVALDDVWRSRVPLGPRPVDETGRQAVTPADLADHEVVRRMTIDEKIAFWREVMQRAADRGIAVYFFTWNIYTYGAEGKYGITADPANRTTIAYFRASVRTLVQTYPLLAGIGITAGEAMESADPGFSRERWLWATYGEGVRDALRGEPGRVVRLIHRFHQTAPGEIAGVWKDYPGYPGTFAYSYKYAVAHMYSSPRPPFIAEVRSYLEGGLKTWLTLRNDDIFSFRWGDPDFAREFIRNLPPPEQLAGFYLGADNFTWGRDFLDRALAGQALGPARPLFLQKHWFAFDLWGRLAFDPTLPDAVFRQALAARFPGADAAALLAASQAASRIIPQTTRFFWGDLDFRWFPEACVHKVGTTRFYTVADFMRGATMPESGLVDIRDWRRRVLAGQPAGAGSPLEVAAALDGDADAALRLLPGLRAGPVAARDRELRLTLGDFEAMAHLGHYYAEKIRGACDLALFDATGRPAAQAGAVAHLERALAAWRSYAAVRDAQYVPNFYGRIGWIDVTALTADVTADIALARAWQPGTLAAAAP